MSNLYLLNPVVQNQAIEINHYHIINAKIPLSFEGFKIAVVADLHNTRFGKKQERLIHHIKKRQPDIIVFAGDQIDRRRYDIQPVLELVDGLQAVAPMYFITGNHERKSRFGKIAVHLMQQHGAIYLDQKSVALKRGEDHIWLSGIGEKVVDIEEIFQVMRAPVSQYQILLCHYPHLLDTYGRFGYDLVLSGHAHGGQWRILRSEGLFAPDQGLFPKYTKGLYVKEKTSMVVSAGLGNSLFPLRLNNFPNLVMLTLHNS